MRELKLLKLSKSSNRGITLIALIITIIVLLILAGISIAMLTGENGILTQAQTSKERTEKAEAIERAKLDIMAWRTNELAKGNSGTITNEQIKMILTGKEYVKAEEGNPGEESFVSKEGHTILYSELYTVSTPPTGDIILTVAPTAEKVEKNTKYQDATSNNKIAVIPAGFAVVPECTTIDDGLVISDVANDENNLGNQFVWIPVDKENFETEFVIRAGYYNNNPQSITNYGEADATGNNTNTSIEESPETQAEAIAMYDSVETNGGFYIGRYEAGTTADSGRGIRGNVVSKKGANIYNHIGWNNDTIDSDITVETGGAVELARKFAEENSYDTKQVHSTLCYGVQWDTALNFIDPGYKGYAKDSSKKGWYSDNYNSKETGNTETNPNHITGKDLIYTEKPDEIANAPKNIYDMGGNVYELTMEAYDTFRRAVRGGYYNNAGSSSTASYRNSYSPSYSDSSIGFRLALYL